MLTSMDTLRTDFENKSAKGSRNSKGDEVFDLSDPASVAMLKKMAQ